ncbi:DUF859 family phage minor structural protein [Streptococcus equinus]|uniref:DUF859 family phage minor structural protein n=1 Tax=Streptococcus equinus TaxID=1335 RepID=UPI0008E0F5AF|nr:DUF859 family phage minor structural protein [Streptococcus equinus]QBX24832.1 capsid and scaffold protein [Streptococcus phage Javan210]SFF76743.1 virus protein of unknown function [Streptococcus equinus]
MATATFSGSYGHNMTLELQATQTSQNIAGNYSTVKVVGRLHTNGYASMWGVSSDVTIHINGGGAIEHPVINIGTNSTQEIFNHTYNVGHDSEGKKTVGVQLSVGLNTGGYGSSMVAFDLPLTQIKRASTGKVTATELGKVATITIDRKNSSFKHTLRYNWDGKTGTIATNVDTSCNWTLPMDFANTVPNADYHWGTVYIDTYNGSTKIGTKEATFNANIPASVKPTLGSITLTDGNTTVSNLLGKANTFAEIVSDIKVGFTNAKGSYSSTIKEYRAEIVGKNQSISENNGNFGIMNWNGEAQVKAWVVDSRGRSSNVVTADITVLEYFLPTLTFTAVRGDTNQSSDKIVVTRTAKIAPLKIGDTQKNSFKLTFKTAPFGTETFTVDTNAGVNDKVTHELINSQATLSGTFDVGKSYEVYGVLEDALTSSGIVKAPPVSPEKMVMGMAETAVSFGKFPENTNAVDSDWAYYYKNQRIEFVKGLNTSADPNTLLTSGAYKPTTTTNLPSGVGQHGQLLVVKSEGDTISQMYMPYNESSVFVRNANGIGGSSPNWKGWKKLANTDEVNAIKNSSNMTNTGWQSAGFTGSYYKRSGDMLAIRFNFTGNGKTFVIAEVPPSVWSAPQEMMFDIAQWSVSGSDNTHVQVNKNTGQFNILNSRNGQPYRGQILVMV